LQSERVIVAITGASGAIYGLRIVEALKKKALAEVHLVISKTGRSLLEGEIGPEALMQLTIQAHRIYDNSDIGAPIASGSFITQGMIIAPCSAKTLSAIAHGYGNNLITRAADVVLKERRRLVVLFRETPLNLAHIENMAMLTRMGGIVLPPIPAFYHKPKTIDDLINQSVGKALDLFCINNDLYTRWSGTD